MTTEFAERHLYLVTTLWGLLSVAICCVLAGPQRRMTLVAGLVTLPFVPLAGTYNGGAFWTPTHLDLSPFLPFVAFGGPVGLEDIFCLFIAGARAWFFATVSARHTWRANATAAMFAARALGISGIAVVLCIGLALAGIGSIPISYVVPVVIGCVALAARRDLWPLAVGGAVGSTIISSIELRTYFAIWPEWAAAWTPGAPTSIDLLGVKLGDLVWWCVVGAVHPLVIACCAGVSTASGPERGR